MHRVRDALTFRRKVLAIVGLDEEITVPSASKLLDYSRRLIPELRDSRINPLRIVNKICRPPRGQTYESRTGIIAYYRPTYPARCERDDRNAADQRIACLCLL